MRLLETVANSLVGDDFFVDGVGWLYTRKTRRNSGCIEPLNPREKFPALCVSSQVLLSLRDTAQEGAEGLGAKELR